MKRRRKKARKGFSNKKRIAVIGVSLTVIVLVFLAIMGIGGLFGGFGNDALVEPVDKETGKVNALIVGVDKGGSLTDTIMVASYDLDNNTVNILSVPRDTRMYIGSKYQKINAAHAISQNGKKKGINGTIEAVSRLTAIPINYYVEFTFDAFRETIDALGGVYFDVPQNMNYDDPAQDLHIHLTKGPQQLDGEKAEQFVRFRRYPMGDIDRVQAQQNFLKAVIGQKLRPEIITKLPGIYKTLQENLTTNITFSDVTRYILNVSELSAENIHMYSLPGTSNGTDYGSSYWIADMQELATLIETTFGYDASDITIHSADGKSVSKDVKKTQPTATPKAKTSVETTPTAKPTQKPESTKKPAATKKPEVTASPEATKKPAATPTAEPTQKPTVKPTSAPTEKPKRPAANTSAGE